jgi:hypothetical protein
LIQTPAALPGAAEHCFSGFTSCRELYLEDKGVEQWKTHFYNLEDWDPKTGYPKRKTMEDLGMKQVADVLQSKNKLGSA